MAIFLPFLQGSYAYLLILQVLVVALLFFTLVWLIVRRAKDAESEDEVQRKSSRLKAQQQNQTSERGEFERKLTSLQKENRQLQGAQDEAEGLKAKVKLLESKLFEYEILQEEIGALSALKTENDKLKRELHKKATAPATPETPAPKTGAPAAAPSGPAAVLFDASGNQLKVENTDTTQVGLQKLLQKINEATEGQDKPAK